MHSGPRWAVEPNFSVSGAENNVEDDVAEGLGHALIMNKTPAEVNRAFSAGHLISAIGSWGIAPGYR
jgi:hypothetical protein